MTLKEDGRYILVMRVADMLRASPESTVTKCCECGEETWLCKSLQNFESDGCVCSHCFIDKRKGKVDETIITDGVRKELYAYVKDRKAIKKKKFN